MKSVLIVAAFFSANVHALCQFTSGNFVSTFVGSVSNGTIVSGNSISIRVPSTLIIKFGGGLKDLDVNQQIKFTSSSNDENGICIADTLEARPVSQVSTNTNSNNKVRGGDR